MEWNKENIIAALFIVAGANTTGILNMVNSNIRANSFSSLDAAVMKAELVDMFTDHVVQEQREFEKLRERISGCEFKVK